MRFDIHVHSSFSSCANINPKRLLSRIESLGLDYVFITDHNTTRFHKYNSKYKLLPGIEVKTDRGEILGLYVQEDIKKGLTPEETIDLIHDQGGLAVPSHPFDRIRSKLKNLSDMNFDAIEVFNGRILFQRFNIQALNSARDFVKLAGSDAHFLCELGSCWNESSFDDPYKAIKSGKVEWHGTFNGYSGLFKSFLHNRLKLKVE